jgi:chromate reductase, NAD(P)H dehydrogenase (quinone)
VNIVGISGSLRQKSFNTQLLRAAQALAPDGVTISALDISRVPLYNDDVRAAGYPPEVADIRATIARADAVLIATPEYNYSVPGVLKNVIDWCSRPPDQPFAGKPLGIMGASGGLGGTIRAQHHLRQIAVFVDLLAMNKPEVVVRNAADKFDENGNLTDESTRDHVTKLVEALVVWTRRLRTSA